MSLKNLYERNTSPTFWGEEENLDNCNCGSFALDLTSWFAPYLEDWESAGEEDECYLGSTRDEMMSSMAEYGCDAEEIMATIIETDWQFILEVCPWLEPITVNDIRPEDRVIAYRLYINTDDSDDFDPDRDTDFHFRVMIDGVWWEKNGAGPIHRVSEVYDGFEEEPWIIHSGLIYSGPIKYARFR